MRARRQLIFCSNIQSMSAKVLLRMNETQMRPETITTETETQQLTYVLLRTTRIWLRTMIWNRSNIAVRVNKTPKISPEGTSLFLSFFQTLVASIVQVTLTTNMKMIATLTFFRIWQLQPCICWKMSSSTNVFKASFPA